MHIIVLSAGKTKAPFDSIAVEYYRRASGFAKIESLTLKDDASFEDKILHLKDRRGAKLILLDEAGENLDSVSFARMLENSELHSEKLLFAIGPADGFSKALKRKADFLLSLSSFTFPHDFVVAIFAEVLYRSLSIKAGHPYHRA